jgi:glycosyltransferase involved in cell wall biosynthesis
LKVLFIFSIPGGGLQTLNHERKSALSRRGLECHFLYFKKPIQEVFFKTDHVYITDKDEEIKNLLLMNQYDAVIVCTYFEYLQRVRQLGFQGKVIFEIQGLGSRQTTEAWLERSKTFVLEHADAVLYPKSKFLDEMIRKNFPNKKLFSFHNCIDTNLFTSVEVPPLNHPIIGWVGRLEANKNWKEFLMIGAALRQINPKIQLWMFHDPTLCTKEARKSFSRWIKKLNLTNHLVIYENVPRHQMPAFYSRMARSGGLLCSTSRQEGFGYVVLEAMSCKCPVLTTKSGGVESFVVHNLTGKLYDVENINNAVIEAKELIENTRLREEIIQLANQLVNTSFKPNQYCDHFMQMLNEIM